MLQTYSCAWARHKTVDGSGGIAPLRVILGSWWDEWSPSRPNSFTP